MKKIVTALFIMAVSVAAIFAVPVAFNESSEENWSSMRYEYVNVYKVLEARDAFVVIYQKGKYGTGTVTLPKKWIRGENGEMPKLRLRTLPGGKLKPFLTSVKDDSGFKFAILTMPVSRLNAAWGNVENGTELDIDKDTLESLY